MNTVGWAVFFINEAGRKVWIHPKGSDRQCFFSEKAAVRYGRAAFHEEKLFTRDMKGEEHEASE